MLPPIRIYWTNCRSAQRSAPPRAMVPRRPIARSAVRAPRASKVAASISRRRRFQPTDEPVNEEPGGERGTAVSLSSSPCSTGGGVYGG